MRANEFITERKMADLYHYTPIFNVVSILKSGKINPSSEVYDQASYGWTSLTRNSYYDTAATSRSPIPARFVIDQGMLANNHRIEPYDWVFDPKGEAEQDDETELRRYESEERVKGPISIRYIKSIDLPEYLNPALRQINEGVMDDALSDLHIEGMGALMDIANDYGIDPEKLKAQYSKYAQSLELDKKAATADQAKVSKKPAAKKGTKVPDEVIKMAAQIRLWADKVGIPIRYNLRTAAPSTKKTNAVDSDYSSNDEDEIRAALTAHADKYN